VDLFRRAARTRSGGRTIVAGLGNPGDRYARTRHNAGAMVLDELLRRLGTTFKRHKSGCLVAESMLAGERVALARPIGFMNESGRPIRALVQWYKAPTEDLIVVHDELDIPFGAIRIKDGGGTAGHNGLGSIVSHLGTKDFSRVRVGIGRPRGSTEGTDYVLSEFCAAERKELPDVIGRAADAVERILEVGLERAMNEVNTR
jgi:PTH1 family peptidyl-tRNA hydrolase